MNGEQCPFELGNIDIDRVNRVGCSVGLKHLHQGIPLCEATPDIIQPAE